MERRSLLTSLRWCACGRQRRSPAILSGTGAIGEQPVVANAVEAAGQDVDEEAADELVRWQCHGLVKDRRNARIGRYPKLPE